MIDQLKSISIVDVVSNHVKLTKKGANYTGKCPFHQEDTASFTVSDAKGIFKCFGCGKSGDAITFVMDHLHMEFKEACEEIAKQHNIDLEWKKLSDEEKQKHENEFKQKESLYKLYDHSTNIYHKQLLNDKQILDFVLSRTTMEMVERFMIGFALEAWDVMFKELRSFDYKEEFLIASDLIRYSEKAKKPYDLFRNRIMFPIHNLQGKVVAFSGRTMSKEKEEAKYLNSSYSLIYNKSSILFGLHQAVDSIVKNDIANLVEGNFDTMRLHQIGIENTIASCGTALTEKHIAILKRYTKNVNLIYDGDTAGHKAIIRSGEMLLETDMNVYVTPLPEGMDPDAFFTDKDQFIKHLQENKTDFITYYSAKLFSTCKQDPVKKSEAIEKIAKLLSLYDDKSRREVYIDSLVSQHKKSHGITKKQFESYISKFVKDKDTEKAIEIDTEELPKYLTNEDKRNYIKYGFYESKEGIEKNQMFFKDGGRKSNFIMKPLFHIDSTNDARKLYEFINKYEERFIIELDMQDMNSILSFRKKIEGKGNLLWEGTDFNFICLKRYLYDKTRYCKKIERLGWQKEGFFAFANGIVNEGNFVSIDENGITEHNGKFFFIPAFSSIYINDKSIYKDERKFIYNPDPTITLYDFTKLFLDVFGAQSILSICFYFTALFSDHIFYKLQNLPMLNLFGPKGSGKSEQAMCLLSLFGKRQNGLVIHNTTKPGLSAHLEQFVNALCFIDEYKNNIPYEMIELLKAIYNRNGRIKGSIKEGISKETTEIDQMVVLCGQEQLTADVALYSRTISLSYPKVDDFTETERNNFSRIKELSEEGLSHITFNLLQYRELFEKTYYDNFISVQTVLHNHVQQFNIEERLLRNMSSVIASYVTLQDHIKVPFDVDFVFSAAIENMKSQNVVMSNSNELNMFWEMIETLVEKGLIRDKENFKIDLVIELPVLVLNKSVVKTFTPGKQILFLKWAGIYQLYAEYSTRAKISTLPSNTLKYYLENSKSFIGYKKSVRFDKDINQAMCFDYDMLSKQINLIRNLNNLDVNKNEDDYKIA